MFFLFLMFLFFFWNIFFGSLLTIPLYKLMCNLSYLDTEFFFFSFNKESFLFDSIVFAEYDVVFNIDSLLVDSIFAFDSIFFFSFLFFDSFFFSFFFLFCDYFFYTCYSDSFVLNLTFLSSVSNFVLLEFISLQTSIFIMAGESALIFFRLYNPTHYIINGLSLYYIYPYTASVFLSKIQCFCFDVIQIFPFETLELPVIFYLDQSILSDFFFLYTSIYLSYVFFLK